jgi:iron(III) transport system permease protein
VLTVYVLVAAVTPLISITLGALSGTGRPNDLTRLSLDPILRVLSSSPAGDAFVTTLQLSLLVGVVTGALALVTTYVARRSSRTFDSFVDTLMTVPVAVPGAVLGLALLWTWLPITYPVDLYGSTTLLVIGYALVALPVAGRLLSASDAQIHPELEEAALVHGAGLFRTFTHVYLPVMASGAVAAFFLSALYVPKEAAVAAMLVTADTTTLPALILAYWRSGDASAVMVMSLLLVLCIVVLWLIQIILRRLIQSRNVRGAK